MTVFTIRDDGTWDYGTPGKADHFLGDHDSCEVVPKADYDALAAKLDLIEAHERDHTAAMMDEHGIRLYLADEVKKYGKAALIERGWPEKDVEAAYPVDGADFDESVVASHG